MNHAPMAFSPHVAVAVLFALLGGPPRRGEPVLPALRQGDGQTRRLL